MNPIRFTALSLAFASGLVAQVPQGWYLFGTFGGASSTLTKGIYMSHPRNPGAATALTGLQGDLVVTGTASILYRQSDGAVLVGERSPVNASVDLHVLKLSGNAVVSDASFSVGTGGPCCGEIPQMALASDGRVVVAATDLSGGPLKQYLSTSYGWQGLGIVDTSSGLVTPIPISNGAAIVDVYNALALSPDEQTVYIGTYSTNTKGDVYAVPYPNGGTATLVATIPAGISNLAFDNDGYLMVTDAYTTQGLFRLNVATAAFTQIPHSSNALNGIANDPVSGGFAIVTGSSGVPARSLLWTDKNGTDHLLASPSGIATPSGVAISQNPARFGKATAAANSYQWTLAPNPGGLPEVGNAGFSLTVAMSGTGSTQFGVFGLATSRLTTPVSMLGVEVWIDFATVVLSGIVPALPSATLALPIPNDPGLSGLTLYFQTFHQETGGAMGATPGLKLTVL